MNKLRYIKNITLRITDSECGTRFNVRGLITFKDARSSVGIFNQFDNLDNIQKYINTVIKNNDKEMSNYE